MRAARICTLSLLSLCWFFACSGDDQASDSAGLAGAAGLGQAGATSSAGGPSGGRSEAAGGSSDGGAATAGASPTAGAAGSARTGSAGSGGSAVVPDAGDWPDVVFEYDAGDAGEPDACASTTVTAEPIPLDLIILLDRSGSMNEPGWQYWQGEQGDCNIDETPIKGSKWCRAINALMDFFESDSSVGTGVGLRTFSDDGEDCEAYPTLDVDFNIIQGGDSDPLLVALESEMNDRHAEGSTPTERALKTIVEFTLARQQENESTGNAHRKVIGILVTDGEPQACNRDTEYLNTIVLQHFEETGIPTFFIGMQGADYRGLNTMAEGAGAPEHTEGCNAAVSPCYYYDVGEGDGSILIDTLEEIRRTVIGCQFAIPEAEVGLVDLDSIEVQFTPAAGEPVETLTRVLGGEDNCGDSDGYYTDDDENPTTILLCPETCRRAEDKPTSSVSIELLCEGA
jgi:hypothetical protein